MAASSRGIPARIAFMSGAGVKKWCCITPGRDSASKGTLPVSIWKATAASEYWSLCAPNGRPAHCSGLM